MRRPAFETLALEVDEGGVALVHFDRPERLNAVDDRLHRELAELFRTIDLDREIRAAVLTGRGAGFSVGGDLAMMDERSRSAEAVLELMADGRRVIAALLDCSKPIVSAVNGIAMGVGCQVAVLSDVAIASHRARFSDGHMIAGVVAGDGAALVWPLLVGMARTKRYLLTGDAMTGAEAAELGLVLEAVDHDALLPTALDWARRLAGEPREAVRLTKLLLNQWLRLGQLISLDHGLAAESLTFLTADARARISGLRDR